MVLDGMGVEQGKAGPIAAGGVSGGTVAAGKASGGGSIAAATSGGGGGAVSKPAAPKKAVLPPIPSLAQVLTDAHTDGIDQAVPGTP